MLLMATPRWIPGQDGSFCVPHDLHLGILFCCQVRLPPLVQRTVPVYFSSCAQGISYWFLNIFPMCSQYTSQLVLNLFLSVFWMYIPMSPFLHRFVPFLLQLEAFYSNQNLSHLLLCFQFPFVC